MGTSIQVQIGEQTFTVQHFRGLKAIMAFASLTRVSREVPDLMADAVKAYQRRNTIVVTESMARLPRWAGFTTEDFDTAEKHSGKREIELPGVMSQNEQLMYSLPDLLEGGRKEIIRLLALLIVPNAELRNADKESKVPELLDQYEDALYDAELDQLVDLCFAAQDVLSEQLSDRKERLGNLARTLWGAIFRRTEPQQASRQQITEETEAPTETSTPQMSKNDAPTSSTSSPMPMDGAEKQLSTTSPGAS